METVFEAAFEGAMGRTNFIRNEKDEQCCSNCRHENLAVHGWIEKTISQQDYSEVTCKIWM